MTPEASSETGAAEGPLPPSRVGDGGELTLSDAGARSAGDSAGELDSTLGASAGGGAVEGLGEADLGAWATGGGVEVTGVGGAGDACGVAAGEAEGDRAAETDPTTATKMRARTIT